MSLDIFLRAETPATYIAWLTTPHVRAIIGDLRARDGDGSVSVPASLRYIPGNVDLVQWDVNEIVEVPAVLDDDGISPWVREIITPAVMDPQAWIHIRLTGDAEIADFTGPPGPNDFDRWEHSRMVTLVSEGTGQSGQYRGVSLFTRKVSGKDLAVFRGSEVETMMKFHEYMGRGDY